MDTVRQLLLVFAITVASALATAQTPQEPDELTRSLYALTLQPRSAAYSRFIDIYLIASPHADKEIQGFIDRASKGETDAFAFVAFMIWEGYVGFRADQISAKLALSTAIKDGSAAAAYFIGETFVQTPSKSDSERAELYADSLHWYGMAAGMGEARGQERALALIKVLAPTNQDHKRFFMGVYNRGLEQGVRNKRDLAKK